MTDKTRYVFIASMDVDAEKETLFNEVYDTEHVPAILAVPGVIAAYRYKVEPWEIVIGDRAKTVPDDAEPRYHAMYEFDDPNVLNTEAWASATESGRWPGEVRPYTRNRRHVLLKKCG